MKESTKIGVAVGGAAALGGGIWYFTRGKKNATTPSNQTGTTTTKTLGGGSGQSTGGTPAKFPPIPSFSTKSTTSLVLGTKLLTASLAQQLTGVSIPQGSYSGSSQDLLPTSLGQAQSIASQASTQKNSPSFVWAYQDSVGNRMYFITSGLYNPIMHVGDQNAGWAFELLYGYVGGKQVGVKHPIVTSTNITGLSPGQYKMVIKKLASNSSPDPVFHNLTDYTVTLNFTLYGGTSSVGGKVTNGFNNGFYSIPAGGETMSGLNFGPGPGTSASNALRPSGLDFTWTDPAGGKHSFTPNAYTLWSMSNGVVFSG